MRRFKRIGLCLSIVVAATVVGVFVMVRAGGEIPESVSLEYPVLEDSENAAFVYRDAWKALEASPRGSDADTLQRLKRYSDSRLSQAGIGRLSRETPSAAELQILDSVLAEAEPVFALLQQARATKGCQYFEDHSPESVYENSDRMLQTLKVTRQLAKYLVARAFWEAEQDNIDAALDWIATGLHLANDIGDESMGLSEGVRKIIGLQMLVAAQGILYENGLSGPIPQPLLDEIEDLRDRRYHGDSLRRESVSSRTVMQAHGRWWFPLQSTWRHNYLETLGEFVEAIEVDDHGERQRKMKEVWETILRSRTGINKYTNYYDSILVAPLFDDEEELEILVAHANLLELGLSLRLYEHAHGVFPDALEDLVPEYLPAIPEDPLNGEEFYYESSGPHAIIRSEMLTRRGVIALRLGRTIVDANSL